MVICTSYFFINYFPSFLEAKVGFEIGLSLLKTPCCILLLQHSAHFPNLVLEETALRTTLHFIAGV